MNNSLIKYFILCAGLLSGLGASAQEPRQQNTEDIIIKSQKPLPPKTVIVLDGKSITINGVPADQSKDIRVIRGKDKAVTVYGYPRSIIASGGPMMTFNPENKAFLGVMTTRGDKGAKITEVVKGSPAATNELKQGDIITHVGKETIDGSESLFKAIDNYKPGDEVELELLRNGKKKTMKVKLSKNNFPPRIQIIADSISVLGSDGYGNMVQGRPLALQKRYLAIQNQRKALTLQGRNLRLQERSVKGFPLFSSRPKMGLQIQDTPEGKGVTVLEVDKSSAAADAGLQKGDLITAINDQHISGVSDVEEQLLKAEDKYHYTLTIQRDGKTKEIKISIQKPLRSLDM